MPNDQCRRNDECPNEELPRQTHFVIRHSLLPYVVLQSRRQCSELALFHSMPRRAILLILFYRRTTTPCSPVTAPRFISTSNAIIKVQNRRRGRAGDTALCWSPWTRRAAPFTPAFMKESIFAPYTAIQTVTPSTTCAR